MQSFSDRLADAVRRTRNPVVVGLDPREQQLPAPLKVDTATADTTARADAYRQFCLGIVDVVAPLVPAIKPQLAFFEALGPPGLVALYDVVQVAREKGLIVILDGKRNDIGSTATAYARAYLGAKSPWGGDCLTVSPYLGDDSLTPFVETCTARGAGIFVLVKTSNPGGTTFQDRMIDNQPLYRHVGSLVERLALSTRRDCGYGDVGAVVGATYPEQLAELREAMPHTWFLVPGFGSQGGTAEDVRHAFAPDGLGAVVNSSRAIIFAYNRPEFADEARNGWQCAVEAATKQMIEQLRAVASL